MKVTVASAGKEETVYNEKHRKDTSTIIFDVKGVGTITINKIAEIKTGKIDINLYVFLFSLF